MELRKIDEAEAYAYLRDQAMKKRLPIGVIASVVVDLDDVLPRGEKETDRIGYRLQGVARVEGSGVGPAAAAPLTSTGDEAPRGLREEDVGLCVFRPNASREDEAMRKVKRRSFLRGSAAALGALVLGGGAPFHFVRNIAKAAEGDTIKVGILHSLSGTIAIIETSLHNAELLAIEEINAKGGVMGKKLEPVIEDAQSLVQVFAEKAKKLLLEDKVAAVLGCYTSASRQSVLPVFEQYNGVLLYPTLYEAQECSKNCFYTGAVPNQQLDDFVPWIINTLGRKKCYMVGSNYIYPKETNREVKALLEKHGGENVGEEYAPLGHTEFSTIINNIAGSGADVMFSDLVGDLIVAFYKQFRQFGLTPAICRSARRSPPSRRRRRWVRRMRPATTPRSTTSSRSTRRRTSPSSSATRRNMAPTKSPTR